MPNGRCAIDGGKSPGAPLKHGRRSKYLPVRLMERYEEALTNPDLISLEDDVALLEGLINDNLSALQLDASSSAELWSSARDKYHETFKGGPTAKEAFRQLGKILENGFGESHRLDRHLDLTERKRRVAETEGRRQAAAHLSVSVKELAVVQALTLAVLREKINDKHLFGEIHAALIAEISRRLGRGAS